MLGLVRLAYKRLFSQFGLMACLALGIAIAVALASAIPAFSYAVQLHILDKSIEAKGDEPRLPPFAFLSAYFGANPMTWEEYQSDDKFVKAQVPGLMGLPITRTVQYVHSPRMRLFPPNGDNQYGSQKQIGSQQLGFITGVLDHISLVGDAPKVRDDGIIDVLVYTELANQAGLQIGERYIIYLPEFKGQPEVILNIRISGIWVEKNAQEDYWFYRPGSFGGTLLVDPAAYEKDIAPAIVHDVAFSLWYYIADGRTINPESGTAMLERMKEFDRALDKQHKGLTVRLSPEGALRQFTRAANELTLLLVIFSVPLVAVALYFIVMVAGMVVRQQEAEIAVLRSRGASTGSIALLYVIAGVSLGVVALALGLLGGLGLAALMTRLKSFLQFSNDAALLVQPAPQYWRFGIGAAVLSVILSLLPALAAANRNILVFRTSQSRGGRPFWQRIFLDVFLLAAAGFIYYQMRVSGGTLLPANIRTVISSNANGVGDPFGDPVRFLAPVLLLTATALTLVRFFPIIMRVLAWLAGRLPVNTSILLALRSLARAPGNYTGPLLLLIFTIGLAVFSASIAQTLDRHLIDNTYFQVGADVRLIETGYSNKSTTNQFGQAVAPSGGGLLGSDSSGDGSGSAGEEPTYYTFVPVEGHLEIPGVRAVTRVGRYDAEPRVQPAPVSAQFIGVDRDTFGSVSYFRNDFASSNLGDLLNKLALDRSAVLISSDFAASTRLRVDEPLVTSVKTQAGNTVITLTVAGTFSMFPNDNTKKAKTEFMIGNLDYLFEEMGTPVPYDVLMRTESNIVMDDLIDQAGSLGYFVLSGKSARTIIQDVQALPQRQGVFGVLSAGFIAASLLTLLGFVLAALISFRQRAIQLGMLRTIGLSAEQTGTYIVLEQSMLIVLGALAGSGLGVLVSRLFIPFMQVGGTVVGNALPFDIRIAWSDIVYIYAALGLGLLFALGFMLWSLRRMKAFEAVKLGAT